MLVRYFISFSLSEEVRWRFKTNFLFGIFSFVLFENLPISTSSLSLESAQCSTSTVVEITFTHLSIPLLPALLCSAHFENHRLAAFPHFRSECAAIPIRNEPPSAILTLPRIPHSADERSITSHIPSILNPASSPRSSNREQRPQNQKLTENEVDKLLRE